MEAQNLSLLFAISTPIAALAALHVWLALNGERGTLLLPSQGGVDPTWCRACILGAMVKAAGLARTREGAVNAEAANDESAREVA